MPPVALPGFVGPTYTTRSINFDAERTINFFPAFGEQGAMPKTRGYLVGTPGLEPFIKADDEGAETTGINAGPIRGLFAQDGRCFVVSGNLFAEIYGNQTFHTYGMVAGGFAPATFASNGQAGHQLFITAGGQGYIFDLVANSFTNISSEGFPLPCVMGGFCDGYFLALKANSIQFNISALEDGLQWDGLDVAQVSESSDNVLSLVTNHREVWLLGSKTTEVWYNSGNASFPFQPIQGTFIEHGTAAAFSAVRLDNTIFWLGADESGARMVWRAQGYVPQRVSTHAIEYFLNNAPRVDNAIAYAYQEEGHSFYVLYVPTMETTLVYDVATNQWHERATTDEKYPYQWFPHFGRCHAFAFGHHLIGDRQSGTIYRQSLDLYSDNLILED